MNPRYAINVFWSDEDECWIADAPDLRHCSAHGDSPAEAVRALETAIALWLESARAHGETIPEPRFRPAA
jgi:predicted RNase H-like HicB family nuclease